MPFKTLKNGRAALVAAAICVATAPSPSFATDGVWLDGASGNIGDDANWQTKYSGTTPKLSCANTTANAAYVTTLEWMSFDYLKTELERRRKADELTAKFDALVEKGSGRFNGKPYKGEKR